MSTAPTSSGMAWGCKWARLSFWTTSLVDHEPLDIMHAAMGCLDTFRSILYILCLASGSQWVLAENLNLKSSYYLERTLTFSVGENDPLLSALQSTAAKG